MEEKKPQSIKTDESTWAILCHASSFASFVIPFGGILGPLIVWLMKRHEYPLVDEQGKESLNFQITMALYSIISLVLILILIGILLLVAIWVLSIILTIVAIVKTSQGEHYRYPLSIRFIK